MQNSSMQHDEMTNTREGRSPGWRRFLPKRIIGWLVAAAVAGVAVGVGAWIAASGSATTGSATTATASGSAPSG
jgi:hypothetical protein